MVQRRYAWKKLPRETQDLYIRLLWNDLHSEGAIAKFLCIGKGVVVRRRQSHLTDLKPRARGAVKSTVDPDRFEDLLDIHKMDELHTQNVVPIAPVAEASAPPRARATPTANIPTIEDGRKIRARRSEKRIHALRTVQAPADAPRPKLAASEATQCEHRDEVGRRCAYERRDAKSRMCVLHSK